MLILKRVQYFNDWVKCDITGKTLLYGEYYYEDDTDGLVVDAVYYHQLKKERKEKEFDYSKLEKAQSQQEYKQMLKEYQRSFLEDGLLDREVLGDNIY